MKQNRTGTLTKWFDDVGFGFVHVDASPTPVFVQAERFPVYQRRPKRGDRVTVRARPPEKGPTKATITTRGASRAGFVLLLLSVFAASYASCIYLSGSWSFPLLAVAPYVLLAPPTFFAYMLDKRRAELGQWRVQEATLHTLEFVGGWPVAFYAQQSLRHKNRKVSYQVVFLAIVTLHILVWTYKIWTPWLKAWLRG